MHNNNYLFLLFIFIISLFSIKSHAQNEIKNQSSKNIIHIVKENDTLWKLSNKYLNESNHWHAISKRNKILNPKHLQIGKKLLISNCNENNSELATIIASSGYSTYIDSNNKNLLSTNNKISLPSSATLKTNNDEFVTLLLPSGSVITLEPKTTAKFLYSCLDDLVMFELKTGRIESKIETQNGTKTPSFKIKHRLATIGVRGTHFRVSSLLHENLTVSTYEGTVSLEKENNSSQKNLQHSFKETLITAGQGVSVTKTGRLVNIKYSDLLKAPIVKSEISPSLDKPFNLQWEHISNAEKYQILWATDINFVNIFKEEVVENHIGDNNIITHNSNLNVSNIKSIYIRVNAVNFDGVSGLFSILKII